MSTNGLNGLADLEALLSDFEVVKEGESDGAEKAEQEVYLSDLEKAALLFRVGKEKREELLGKVDPYLCLEVFPWLALFEKEVEDDPEFSDQPHLHKGKPSGKTTGERAEELLDTVKKLMEHPDPRVRKEAHRAYLKHKLSGKPDNQRFNQIVRELVEQGYFFEDSTGQILVWQGRYRLSGELVYGVLDQRDQEDIKKLVEEHIVRIQKEWTAKAREQSKSLYDQSSIAPLALLEGKSGPCAIEIPARRPFWGRGTVLVDSRHDKNEDCQKIFFIDASGGVKRDIDSAKEMDIFVKLYSLKRSDGTLKSKEETPSIPSPKKRLPPDDFERFREWASKVVKVWRILQCGLEVEVQKKEREDYLVRLRTDTVSLREFPNQEGFYLFEFSFSWKERGGEIAIERPPALKVKLWRDDEDHLKVRIVEFLPDEQCEEYFQSCLGEHFLDSDDSNFRKLPERFGRYLRACIRYVQKEDRVGEVQPV